MPSPTLPVNMTPLVSGYSIGDPGGVSRTEVAGGFSRVALEWDRGQQLYTVTLLMDAARLSVWTVFYHLIIKKGSIPFFMPISSGADVSQHLVQIIPGTYSIVKIDEYTSTASFSVEAENPVYDISEADAILLIEFYNIYGETSEAFLNRLAQFANFDSLVLDF